MRYLDPRRSRQAAAPSQKAGPAHRPAAGRSPRASPASVVEHDAPHASERSRLDIQRGHVRSQRCVATLERSSTAHDRADARSLAPRTSGEQHRDLLALGKGQIAPRHRREGERRHPATLAKPPDTNTRQHTRLDRSLLTRCASSDRLPEPHPMLPSPRRRMSTPTRSGCRGTIPRPVSSRHDNSQRQALRQPVESTWWRCCCTGIRVGSGRRGRSSGRVWRMSRSR